MQNNALDTNASALVQIAERELDESVVDVGERVARLRLEPQQRRHFNSERLIREAIRLPRVWHLQRDSVTAVLLLWVLPTLWTPNLSGKSEQHSKCVVAAARCSNDESDLPHLQRRQRSQVNDGVFIA